jgi:N-acetylmuramoyl-L-alanine amidase
MIRIEYSDEEVCLGKRAKLKVYDGRDLIAEIEANTAPQRGADGGDYPGVCFKVLEQERHLVDIQKIG